MFSKLFIEFCFINIEPDQKFIYTIEVKTDDMWLAGTDDTIEIQITGSKRRMSWRVLSARDEDFERGQTDEFKIKFLDLGDVCIVNIKYSLFV